MRLPVLSSRTNSDQLDAGEASTARGAQTTDDRRVVWVLLALSLLPVVVATIAAARQPWLPASDNAVIELRSLDVFGDPPLTGAYSRYGFDHPGPFEFYVMAAPLRVLGPGGMLWASGLIAAVSVATSVWLAWRRGGLVLGALTTLAVTILVAALGTEVVSPWNPVVPILPFLALVLLTWSVTCDDWWALPGVMVAAAFTAQAHLAYLPFAAVLSLVALAWAGAGWWRRRRASGSRDAGDRPPDDRGAAGTPVGAVVVALVLAAALWSGPIVDQVAGDGNLRAIVEHATTDQPVEGGLFGGGQTVGFDRAAGVVAAEMSVPGPWTGGAEPVEVFTGQVESAPLWRLAPLAVLFAVAGAVALRRRQLDALKLHAIVLGLTAVSFVAVSRIDGIVFTYLVQWLWVVGALVLLSSVWNLLSSWRPSFTEATRWSVVGAVGVVAVLVGVGVRDNTPPQPLLSDALRDVIDPTVDALPDDGVVLVRSSSDFGTVSLHGGMVGELDRRGVDVRVPDDERHRLVYGSRTLGEGETVAAEVWLGPVVPAPDDGEPATGEVVAVRETLSPDERAELARLEAAIGDLATLATMSDRDFERLVALRERSAASVRVVVAPGPGGGPGP